MVLHILCPLGAHLVCDLLFVVALPELREPALIVHHVLTLALAVLALWPMPFGHHFDIFFAGVCEASNLPLGVMEAFKTMPAARALHPRVYRAAKDAFLPLFVALRLVYWPCVSYQFWSAALAALREGHLPEHASAAGVIFYLCANGGLTALQLLWGAKLLRGRFLRGSASDTGLKDE